jgi:hypothetical protein
VFWQFQTRTQLWGVKPLVEGMSILTRSCNTKIEKLTICKLHGRNSNIVKELIWSWNEVEETTLDVFDMAFLKVCKEIFFFDLTVLVVDIGKESTWYLDLLTLMDMRRNPHIFNMMKKYSNFTIIKLTIGHSLHMLIGHIKLRMYFMY